MSGNVAMLLAATILAATHSPIQGRADVAGPFADTAVVDPAKARTFSDDLVKAIVAEDLQSIRGRMEPAFRKAYDLSHVRELLDQMFAAYGKPLEAEFKSDEVGKQVYEDGTVKPLRKFWYALRTTTHDKGSYFMIIAVVRGQGESLACVTFSIVSFFNGRPEHLR
jgi:hypothetical protein